jgi:hypothetical protein
MIKPILYKNLTGAWHLYLLYLHLYLLYLFTLCTPRAAQAAPPDGSLDAATPQVVGGWARDRDYGGPVNVHIYIDGVFHKALVANTPRPDLPCACAWSWTPPPLGMGRHRVEAYAIGVDAQGNANGENHALSNGPRYIQDGCNGLVVPGQGGTAHEWCLNNNAYWINRPTDTLYLSNRNLRFGVNRSYGGTIFELYDDDHNENLILEHGGGAMQLSLWGYDARGPAAYWYTGGCGDPTPYPDAASCEARHPGQCMLLCCSEGAHVASCGSVQSCAFGAGAPWNPIQAQASGCGWDNPTNDVSAVGVHENPPWIHIVKNNPQQFTKSDAFPDLTWEQVARLMPAGIQVDYVVRYTGSRVLTEHPQEMPALFPANGIHAQYSFYEGGSPWTGGGVRTIGDPGRASVRMPGRNLTGSYLAELSESWISVCDAGNTRCLTLASFSPLIREVVLGTGDGQAYLTPMGLYAITPGLDISWTVYVFPYRYDQVVEGMSIRDHIRELARGSSCFAYGVPCDDGDACTSGDACDGGGRCVGQDTCSPTPPPPPMGGDDAPMPVGGDVVSPPSGGVGSPEPSGTDDGPSVGGDSSAPIGGVRSPDVSGGVGVIGGSGGGEAGGPPSVSPSEFPPGGETPAMARLGAGASGGAGCAVGGRGAGVWALLWGLLGVGVGWGRGRRGLV